MGQERELDPRLPCPRCADYLNETRVHESVLSSCRSCGGMWIDSATIGRLRTARDHEVEAAAQRVAKREPDAFNPPDRSLSIACPVCRQSLQRTPFPGTSEPIDWCAAHGTWLDHAEILGFFARLSP
jgi:Zn-finger nucleic acid-binding protein